MGSVTCEMGKGGNNLAGPGAKAAGLQPDLDSVDEWVASADLDAFRQEVKDLGETLLKNQGQPDIDHLNKIIMWANICATIGLLTLWMSPNPFTIIALSTWCCARWTRIGHHVCHGGYDKADKSKTFNRFKWAVGGLFNRLSDWFDWFLPEAWNVEHNNMHHYSLGEVNDPDLVENNLIDVRQSSLRMPLKYVQVLIMALIWKWFYYAPNTYKEYKMAQLRKRGLPLPDGFDPQPAVTIMSLFFKPGHPVIGLYSRTEFITNVVGPYLLIHFFMIPAPLLLLADHTYFWNAVTNLVLAELLTNLHSFTIILTNHAGDDLYRFDNGCNPKTGVFFVRQVISSVNFATGSDLNDFMHGWLNYQIEHHLWPNLSMLSYQRAQPQVKAICEKYNVPYVQHNVFWRLHKTVEIMVGATSMKRLPSGYEPSKDLSSASREEIKAEGGVKFD